MSEHSDDGLADRVGDSPADVKSESAVNDPLAAVASVTAAATGFDLPRRQAPFGVLILFAENLNKLIRITLAIVVGSTFSNSFPFSIQSAGAIAAVAMAIWTFVQYLRFKFHIEGEDLILEKGVLQRERLTIPFQRIQTVHLEQNLIQQLLQLTGVRIETAGSAGSELKISALSKADARALQQILSAKVETSTAHQEGQSGADESAQHHAEAAQSDVLMELSIGRLMVVGLTQNHIRNGLFALFALSGYYSQFADYIDGYILELMGEQWAGELERYTDQELLASAATTAIASVVAAVSLFSIVAVGISMVRTVLKHFGLVVRLGKKTIYAASGLLKRNEYSFPLSKVQMVAWSSNVLQRIPGFETVRIHQSSSAEVNALSAVEIPACYDEHRRALEEALFPAIQEDETQEWAMHPYYIFYSTIFTTLFFGVLAIGPMLYTSSWWSLLVLPVIALLSWRWSHIKRGRCRLSTDGHVVVYRKGVLTRDRTMLQAYKVQSVRLSRSIWQRKRGVAHLKLFTAGGALTLGFLPEEVAQSLYDRLLYRIETEERSWM